MSVFEAFLNQYKKRSERRPELKRADIEAVFNVWPEAESVVNGLLNLFGESVIEIDQVDLIGAALKGTEKIGYALKDTTEPTRPPELMIKLTAAYNHYHGRRLKAEAYFSGPGADPKHRTAYEDIKKKEAAARIALNDLQAIDGFICFEDEKGFLKLYRETGAGLTELKFTRRAA